VGTFPFGSSGGVLKKRGTRGGKGGSRGKGKFFKSAHVIESKRRGFDMPLNRIKPRRTGIGGGKLHRVVVSAKKLRKGK